MARKIGLPAEQVFKTLLTRASSGEYLFAVIPGDCELDLKKLAAAAEVKRVELASLKEVEPLTGYVRGGVTVMAARTEFPAYVDETIELFDVIAISAGVRGTQMLMAPADYLRATGATLADLTKSTCAARRRADEQSAQRSSARLSLPPIPQRTRNGWGTRLLRLRVVPSAEGRRLEWRCATRWWECCSSRCWW